MQLMEVSNKYLQVRGKLEALGEYKHGDELMVTVCITDIQDKDNFDGTLERTYKAKMVLAE